jgi:hypothetical protein
MVDEFDNKSLMPLLVAKFKILNLNVVGLLEAMFIDDDESIFEAMTSNEVTLHGLLKDELRLFHHLPMKLKDYLLPLTWWKSHEIQILNVSFVARKFFRIPGS